MAKRLPDGDLAEVSDSKIVDYLLADGHPGGAAKARFFRALGFVASRPQLLRRALLEIALRGELIQEEDSRFGSKFVVDGYVNGPAGSAWVRTVWIRETASAGPRFVTAYPASDRSER